MMWRAGLSILALALVSISPVAAHEYTSLPLLVNIHAYPNTGDAQNEHDYEFLKDRFEKTVQDANRILSRASTQLGKDRGLRLGPIRIERDTSGAQTVRQGTKGARDLVAAGEAELRSKQKNKGVKIYIVNTVENSGGNAIPGLGDQGNGNGKKCGRVSWFPDGTFTVAPGMDGLEGNAGQFLLHELGHNAGMARNHEASDNGVHFMKTPLGSDPPDERKITEAQWTQLARMFEKLGSTQANEDQQGAFLPPATDRSAAFVADPEPAMTRPLDWLALAIDDEGRMRGELAWDQAWDLGQPLSYSIAIGLDLDDDTLTGDFPSYGAGIDGLIEIFVEHSPGFGPFVDGALQFYDPDYQYQPLESLELAELGLTGADGDFDPDRTGVQFGHDVSGLPAPAAEVPLAVKIVEDSFPYTFSAAMEELPSPDLTSLPVILESYDTFTVSGTGFAPGEEVDIFFDSVEWASLVPVTSGVVGGGGSFDLPVTVAPVADGDYVVTAADRTGIIAMGIVTVDVLIFSDGFEAGSTSLWSAGSS